MSAVPDNVVPFRFSSVMESPDGCDARERRPTPVDPVAGFTQVDNSAILNTKLSLAARMLYVILRQHRNGGTKKCCPAYLRLCELLGTPEKPAARSTVARSLKELLDAGLVAWERHGGVNDYWFKGDDGFDGIAEVAHGYFLRRSSTRLHPKLSDATSEVAHGYSNNMKLTTRIEQQDSAPTERAAPPRKAAAKVAAKTSKQPTPTVEAKPDGETNVPPTKRARGGNAPSGDGFGLVGWLLKEQGGIARAEYAKVADAKAADTVIGLLGGVEEAREHATARLMEPRRTTLLWSHILEDVQRAEAARQRGVVERRPPRATVSAADGFGAVARRARGEENEYDQRRDGRTATTTFDGVARPL